MDAEVQGYLTELGILREQISSAIQGLSDEAANWRPLPEGTNSIHAILYHMAGSESYWVRQVINRETIDRDREAEFHASGVLKKVLERWEEVGRASERILSELSPRQLGETRVISHPERSVSVRWCLLHVISHCAVHLGHIQLTRQSWEHR